MFKKILSALVILAFMFYASNLFAENQPKNIYDSAYIQIKFNDMKFLSDGKIIIILSYIYKNSEESKSLDKYNIELNVDKDSKPNTFLIDNLGNQYQLINAESFEPRLPVTYGTETTSVMIFSNTQKHESIEYSKLQFTLVSEQTVSESGTPYKMHVVLKLYQD
ncbi:hypothetical protein [Desulfotignum phosphitoxidans]|uniref:Uncharacterized protein n=1 Tax=Desulfotignum phosphitoxidans DSM 13687 TaxID=1286635 RepID=S0FTI9_9BACT|nr:hypothetical protein [Desulfotignum phosphitoxidans]EMS78408.1 hypothetical protein Dpo_8c00750 [Desulfotignum phosphitoxidans DSM 13687]